MSTKTVANSILQDLQTIIERTQNDLQDKVGIFPGTMVAIAQSRVNSFLVECGLEKAYIMVDCDKNGNLTLDTLETI